MTVNRQYQHHPTAKAAENEMFVPKFVRQVVESRLTGFVQQVVDTRLAGSVQQEVETRLAGVRQATTFDALFNDYGVLKSSRTLPPDDKRAATLCFDFKERAYVAMTAAQFYEGGDYFEFGSEGLATFRNFLTAFDLTGKIESNPNIKFYAFDIFGDMAGAKDDLDYFKGWHDSDRDRYAEARATLSQHGLFVDRCHLVRGFFKSTLSPEFKERYLRAGGAIGFAFLDCNITNSYRTVFEFLEGTLTKKAFIYMDEYYCNDDVPPLFERFCEKTKRQSMFIRSAGAFGAMFQLLSLGRQS